MSSEFGHSEEAGSAWRAMYDLVAGREAHSRLVAAADALGVAPGVVKALIQLQGDGLVAMRDLADFFRRAQAESRKGGEQGKEKLRQRLSG